MSIPKKINIKQFIDKDLIFEEDINYELYGIINHEGSLDLGHYYSFIKLEYNNKWYIYNDNLVEEIELNLENNICYILFYIKLNIK